MAYIEPIFKDITLTKFIKNILKKGKLNLSFKLYYQFFNLYFIKKKKIIKKKNFIKQYMYNSNIILKIINNIVCYKKINPYNFYNYSLISVILIRNIFFFLLTVKIKNNYNNNYSKNNYNKLIFLKNIKKITPIFYYKLLFERRKKNLVPKITNYNKLVNLAIKSFIKSCFSKYKNKSFINKLFLEFDLLFFNKHDLIKNLNSKNNELLKKKFFILKYVK